MARSPHAWLGSRSSRLARLFFLLFSCLLAGWVALVAAPLGRVQAAEGIRVAAPPLEMVVDVGFDHRFRPGSWTPVGVTLRNGGPSLEAVLEFHVRQGALASQPPALTIYKLPVQMPPQSDRRWVVPLPLRQSFHQLEVYLRPAAGPAAQAAAPRGEESQVTPTPPPLLAAQVPLHPLASNALFLLVLDRRAGGWQFLRRDDRVQKVEVLYAASPSELPDQWIGYDGVAGIIVGEFPLADLRPSQVEALRQWVEMGGRLLVTANRLLPPTGADAWRSLLPVRLTGRTRTVTLQSLGEAYIPLPRSGSLVAWESVPQGGEVLVSAGELPLAAAREVGAGRVAFVAVDLTVPLLEAWAGRQPFVQDLLGGDLTPPSPRPRLLEEPLWTVLRTEEIPSPSRLWAMGLAALYGLAVLAIFGWRAADDEEEAGPDDVEVASEAERSRRAALARQPWLAAAGTALVASLLMAASVGRSGAQFRRAAAAVTVLAGAPSGGTARSLSFVGMVQFDRGSWQLTAPTTLHVSRPISAAARDGGQPVEIEELQGEEGHRLLRLTGGQRGDFQPVMVEGAASLPVSVRLIPDGRRGRVEVDNRTPYPLVRLVVLDRDRFTMLERVEAHSRQVFLLPPAEDWWAGTPSADWLAAAERGGFRRRGLNARATQQLSLVAMELVLRAALGREVGSAGPPWGLPAVVAVLDGAAPPFTLLGPRTLRSVTFVVVPLREGAGPAMATAADSGGTWEQP